MSENVNDQQLMAALRRLPMATASAQAKELARAAFLAGAVSEGDLTEGRDERRGRSRWATLLLAAALGILAVFLYGWQPEASWVVLDTVEEGGITVDGKPLAVGDSFTGGDIVVAAGSELELQLGEDLRVRLLSGTSLELPQGPGRWFGRSRKLELQRGEIFGTSGSGELGFDLAFVTGELSARLTGTTFAVFRTDEASCVCLWVGGIDVTALGTGEVITLEPQSRVWIYRDGRAPEVMPLSDMETMKLQMIDEAGLANPPQDQ
jgi:ferric-dicitrate binding protein FerR (iron transport regulator)